MSPTVFKYKNYRFFFFSREESRMHVHVSCNEGEAKFWIEPTVALAEHFGLSLKQLKQVQKIIGEHQHEIKKAWARHFKS